MYRKFIYILTLALSISLLLISAAVPAQANYSTSVQLLKKQIFDQGPSWTNEQVCAVCHDLTEGIGTLESTTPVATQFASGTTLVKILSEKSGLLATGSLALHGNIGFSHEQELTIAAFMRSLPGSPHSLAMSFFIPLVNR